MSVEKLKDLFQKHEIRTVAIIDDAYLEHPTLADLRAVGGLKSLWAGIEASDDALEFLGAHGVSLAPPEDINKAGLEKLYQLSGGKRECPCSPQPV